MALLSLGLHRDEQETSDNVTSLALIQREKPPRKELQPESAEQQEKVLAPDSDTEPGEALSAEPSSLPPEVEELRKQIVQGIAPNFYPNRPTANSPEPPAAPNNPDASTSTRAFLSPIMERLQKKLAEDAVPTPAVLEVNNRSAQSLGDNDASAEDASPSAPSELWSSVLEGIRNKFSEDVVSPAPVVGAQKPVALPPAYVPSFATFKFGYLPGRGLLYSIIGHEAAMFALFLFITYILPTFREQKLIVGSLSSFSGDHVIYLPEVGGGTEGQKSPGGGKSQPQEASAAPARASKGFAYPGTQAILSDPPNPTNVFQTVLHPLVVRPEALNKLVPLPNVVQMAETRLPKDLVAPKPTMPAFQPPPQPIRVKRDSSLRRDAKWDVPVTPAPQLLANAEMPKLPAAQQPLPEAPKLQPKKQEEQPREAPKPRPIKVNAEKRVENPAPKEVAPPSTAQIARLEMHGKAPEPLLSLSPAPLPQNSNAKVPAGEARGRFAIAPGGTLNPSTVAPGKPNGTPSASPATGQEKSEAANAATELAANAGTGAAHNPAGGGGLGNSAQPSGGGSAGIGNGSGNTAGAGVGGAGTANGRGTTGTGAGRSGRGAGTGSGEGSGAGSGAFPGITIQGGEGGGNSDTHGLTVAPETPYQITIVATASSGGGLPDFGVFANERVYTVYIPMQRTPQEADPTWTLQYALEGNSAGLGNGQLLAPSPVIREWPQIPADLEKRYSQREVVLYAILGADGKVSHISVKQTPDAQVSEPIVQAFAKWVFRPAQQNNQPVAVKILVGIPL